jgi:glutathione S-transferase
MALKLNNQSFIVREVDLKDKPDDMLKISPKGTVPVMVLPDGTVLEESMHIMHWAFDRGKKR